MSISIATTTKHVNVMYTKVVSFLPNVQKWSVSKLGDIKVFLQVLSYWPIPVWPRSIVLIRGGNPSNLWIGFGFL